MRNGLLRLLSFVFCLACGAAAAQDSNRTGIRSDKADVWSASSSSTQSGDMIFGSKGSAATSGPGASQTPQIRGITGMDEAKERGDSRDRSEPIERRDRIKPQADRKSVDRVALSNEFQSFIAKTTGLDLPLYGYNLFEQLPSTFSPLDNVPVTADYVVGPGDEVVIRAWGAIDIDVRAFVDRSGTINIPKVGIFGVAGIRYQDLQAHVQKAISRVYRNFELSVNLGKLRAIQVFVVGQALRPGSYTLGATSTLVNAVFAAGGPSGKGSMRAVQLKRDNKVVSEFDLYDLIVKGDMSKDARLLPGDVIYFPPVGELAAVSGSVNIPAIFELKKGAKLGDLLQLAGGITPVAQMQKASIERIDGKSRRVDEVSLDQKGLDYELRNGDVIAIKELSPRFDKAVTLRGNVAAPSRHPWYEGMRVKDLIPEKDALIAPEYWIRRNLMTRDPLQTKGSAPIEPAREPLDPSKKDEANKDKGIRNEGNRNEGNRNETTTQDNAQFNHAKSARESAPQIKRGVFDINWDYATIERIQGDLSMSLLSFNLAKAIVDGDPGNNLLLLPGDVVTVYSVEDIRVPRLKRSQYVSLEGEVAAAGVYQVKPGETLRQLLTRVGGLSPNAYLYGAEFTREEARRIQQKQLSELADRMEMELSRAASRKLSAAGSTETAQAYQLQSQSQNVTLNRFRNLRATGRIVLEVPPNGQLADIPDVVLEDGDRFYVPPVPSTVSVYGAVYNQNSFIYRDSKGIDDYLAQSGGPARNADPGALYVLHADGSVSSRRSWNWLSGDRGERIMPGDAILVPEETDKVSWMLELKDWTQIMYQFGLGAAGIKILRQ